MKNSILENELAVTRKSSDDTMEKLKDVEGKCNHLQQNLDKYVLCPHMYLKLQDA
jgi:myosin-5